MDMISIILCIIVVLLLCALEEIVGVRHAMEDEENDCDIS